MTHTHFIIACPNSKIPFFACHESEMSWEKFDMSLPLPSIPFLNNIFLGVPPKPKPFYGMSQQWNKWGQHLIWVLPHLPPPPEQISIIAFFKVPLTLLLHVPTVK